MKVIRNLRASICTLALLVGLTGVPAASAYAAGPNLFNSACNGNTSAAVCGQQTTSDPLTGPNGVVPKVTRVVAMFAGAVAVIIMITGGFMYVLSGGDSGKVSRAKDTIIYAAVGLAVIALGQAVVIFVLDKV